MKKQNLIIFIVVFIISILCVVLGAMLKVMLPEHNYSILMGIGATGSIISVVFIAIGVLRKVFKTN